MAAAERVQAPALDGRDAARERLRRAVFAARESFAAFCELALPFAEGLRPHQLEMVPVMADVASTPGARQISAGPPQHGKTSVMTIAFVAWCLGRGEAGLCDIRSVLVASYNQPRAAQLVAAVRDCFKAGGVGRLVFPEAQLIEPAGSIQWSFVGRPANEPSLSALGVGMGTGLPAQLIVVDDYTPNFQTARSPAYQEQVWSWWTGTLSTRMQSATRMVVTATRWLVDDLPGRLMQEDSDWRYFAQQAVTELPSGERHALWPERFPLAFLDRQRAHIGDREFNTLYQASPVPDKGAFFDREDLERCTYDGPPPKLVQRATGWDTAEETGNANCWTAGFGGGIDEVGIVWVDDITLRRVKIDDLVRLTWAGSSDDPEEVAVIEKASSGVQAVQFLEGDPAAYSALIQSWPADLPKPRWLEQGGVAAMQRLLRRRRPVHGRRPKDSKDDRARALVVAVKSGLLRLPRWHPLYEEVVRDLLQYPLGQRKDTVDALAHQYRYLRSGADVGDDEDLEVGRLS